MNNKIKEYLEEKVWNSPSRTICDVNAEVFGKEELQAICEGAVAHALPEKTLRDEFAIAAFAECSKLSGTDLDPARACYLVADTMMEAR